MALSHSLRALTCLSLLGCGTQVEVSWSGDAVTLDHAFLPFGLEDRVLFLTDDAGMDCDMARECVYMEPTCLEDFEASGADSRAHLLVEWSDGAEDSAWADFNRYWGSWPGVADVDPSPAGDRAEGGGTIDPAGLGFPRFHGSLDLSFETLWACPEDCTDEEDAGPAVAVGSFRAKDCGGGEDQLIAR